MSSSKRSKVIRALKRKGPKALPGIKAKAKSIRQRGYRITDRGGEFDFDPEIELNELAFEIEGDHGIGIMGLIGNADRTGGPRS
jgi:hypothetical protein